MGTACAVRRPRAMKSGLLAFGEKGGKPKRPRFGCGISTSALHAAPLSKVTGNVLLYATLLLHFHRRRRSPCAIQSRWQWPVKAHEWSRSGDATGSRQPIYFLVRTRACWSQVNCQRTIGIELWVHPADGILVRGVRNQEVVLIICHGPKCAGWRHLTLWKCNGVLLSVVQKLMIHRANPHQRIGSVLRISPR
jgi:hypothetical protein